MTLVNDMLRSEVDFFHIRKPDLDEKGMREFIKGIDESYHYKIMINSHYNLIQEFDLAGIHLNKKSLSRLTLAEESHQCHIEPLLLEGQTIKINNQLPNHLSYSAHSFKELTLLPFKTDYVMLSPIFDSISKKGYTSAFANHDELMKNISITDRQIIALGGMTPDRIDTIQSLGFKGYAMLGGYWRDFDAFNN